MTQNYINHIALVLDASASMRGRKRDVVTVAEGEIAHLARRSQELDQETRVTVYAFADQVECLVYDKDVLRLPSLGGLYRTGGNTALIAATMKSQDDLAATAQLYGDHAFLTYVLTDGEENVSRYSEVFTGHRQGRWGPTSYTTAGVTRLLGTRLAGLADNWTVACLVPDQRGAHEAKSFGFPGENVAVWDTTSRRGVEDVGGTIRRATETFMTNRARGIRGSRTLFTAGADVVNRETVRDAGLKPLGRDTYRLFTVCDDYDLAIRPHVAYVTGEPYRTGSAFYELTKPEKVQAYKQVCVRNRKSGRIYAGAEARELLGLPDAEVRVRPEANPEYQVFVQSTSVNRKLVAGTKLLVLQDVPS